jgi:protein CpxP
MYQLINRAGRVLATATLLGTLLSTVALQGASAQQAATPISATQPAASASPEARHTAAHSEKRITELHAKLHITAAQESLWGTFAQTMRDNGQTMRASMTDRATRLKTMTAVDDLKSYQVLADAHSDGLKHLIPAFEALYASMTPDQQKRADRVFSEHQHHAHG